MTNRVFTLALHSTPVSAAEFNLCRMGQRGYLQLPADERVSVGDYLAVFDRRNCRDMILKRVRGIIPMMDKPGWYEYRFKEAKSAVIRCDSGNVPAALRRAAG